MVLGPVGDGLGWAWGKGGEAAGAVAHGTGQALGGAANAVGQGAGTFAQSWGHALGSVYGGAGHLLAPAAGGVAKGAGTFAGSWGHMLGGVYGPAAGLAGKAAGGWYGWVVPHVWAPAFGAAGKALAPAVGPALGGLGGGLAGAAGGIGGGLWAGVKGLGLASWKGAALLGGAFLAGLVALKVLAGGGPQTQIARKLAHRTAGRNGRHGGSVSIRVHTGGKGTSVLMVLVVLMLLGVVQPAQLWGGATGAVQGYTAAPSSYGTSCAPPAQGAPAAGYRVGHALWAIGTWEPDREQRRADVVHWLRLTSEKAGQVWGSFKRGAAGKPPAAGPTSSSTPPVSSTSCCPTSTTPPGGIPTSYTPQPGDTAGMTAARAAVAAGFPADQLVRSVAVAYAESGPDQLATHHNADGSDDYGLWQINSVHRDLLATHDWRDPVQNAQMALAVSDGGTDWSPWTTFRAGLHLRFLAQAQADVLAVTGQSGAQVQRTLLTVPTAAPLAVPAAGCLAQPAGTPTPGAPTVEAAITRALGQLGVPYSWGGGGIGGPSLGIAQGARTVGFDCSGLVEYAYQLAGNPSTRELVVMGVRIAPGQEQRGDLVFPDAGHVGIALGDGTYVEAPHTGDVVKVAPYGSDLFAVVRLSAGVAA